MEEGAEEVADHSAAGRVEIDTSAPFQSVKEAVILFGEKVLAGELYSGKIHQIQMAIASKKEIDNSRFISVATELEETRLSLEKAREESHAMVISLASLKEELDKTKRELQQLRERESEKRVIEEVRKSEDATEADIKMPDNRRIDFQRQKCVTFANPPSLRGVVIPEEPTIETLERQSSMNDRGTTSKKKKRNLIPLLKSLFAKKKG